MNWTALVYGGPMLLVTIWWFVSARKWFKGPKVNVEHLMLGRGGNVLVGKAEAEAEAEVEAERDGRGNMGRGRDKDGDREAGSEGEVDLKRGRSNG
jgi:hypothetical protein